jgi:O-antigen/teichoic acid export membrane protein
MRNLVFSFLTGAVNVGIPILTIPILVGGVGVDEYGAYMLFVSKLTVLIALFEFGMGMSFPLLYSRQSISKQQMLTMFLILRGLAVTPLMVMLYFVSNGLSVFELLLASCLLFNPEPIFVALQKFFRIMLLSFSSKIVLFVGLVMVVGWDDPISYVKIVYLVSGAASSFFGVLGLLVIDRISIGRVSFVSLLFVLRFGLQYYFARTPIGLIYQGNVWMVSIFVGGRELGLYALAFQVYRLSQTLIASVAKVVYSHMVKVDRLTIPVGVSCLSLLALIISLSFLVFFGEQFGVLVFKVSEREVGDLVKLIMLVLIASFFLSLSSFWGYPVLSPRGGEKYGHISSVLVSVFYLALFFLAVVYLNLTASSFVFVLLLSEFLGFIVRVLFVLKVRGFR